MGDERRRVTAGWKDGGNVRAVEPLPQDRVGVVGVPAPTTPTRSWWVLLAWACFLVGVRMWGLHIVATRDADLKLGAVPLYGNWDWTVTWLLLLPLAAGGLAIALLPRLSRDWSWPGVLALTATAGVLMSLALAAAETHPNAWSDIHSGYTQYITLIDDAGGVGSFLRDYTDSQLIPDFPVHLRSHPPGLLLAFWAAAQVGLSGPAFANAVAMVSVAAAIVAALAILRDVAGERWARAAAPFLVVAPAAVWHTNADVIFAGVVLSGVACLVLATGRSGSRALLLAVAGGLLWGAALMLSFGIALLAVPVVVVAVWRVITDGATGRDGAARRDGPAARRRGAVWDGSASTGRSWTARWLRRREWLVLVLAGTVAVAVVLLPLTQGYWWLDGLAATRERYYGGVADTRGYWYFLVANLAVFALAIGPAVAVALSRLRDRRVWLVVGSGIAVVLLADLSGLSSAETERIWQPFMPLVLLAGGALWVASGAARDLRGVRGWLALQLAVTLVLAAALRVEW